MPRMEKKTARKKIAPCLSCAIKSFFEGIPRIKTRWITTNPTSTHTTFEASTINTNATLTTTPNSFDYSYNHHYFRCYLFLLLLTLEIILMKDDVTTGDYIRLFVYKTRSFSVAEMVFILTWYLKGLRQRNRSGYFEQSQSSFVPNPRILFRWLISGSWLDVVTEV